MVIVSPVSRAVPLSSGVTNDFLGGVILQAVATRNEALQKVLSRPY